MNPNPMAWFQHEVLPRLDPRKVYEGLGKRETSGWHRGPCPRCGGEERTRRCGVHSEHLGFKCGACDASGSVLAGLNGGIQPTGEAFWAALAKGARLASVPLPDWLERQGWNSHGQHPCKASTERDWRAAEEARQAKRAQDERRRKERAARRHKQVAALDAAALPAKGSPAAKYLARRMVWPVGLRNLPETVRWLPAERVRPVLHGWGLPPDAAGCIAYRLEDAAGSSQAWHLDALTAQGRRTGGRWRRNVGGTKGAMFRALNLPGGCIHVAEGPADALALGCRCLQAGEGAALATVSTEGRQAAARWLARRDSRPVTVHADGDAKGRMHARALCRILETLGRDCDGEGLYADRDDKRDEADRLSHEIRGIMARHVKRGRTGKEAWRDTWREWLQRGGN